MIYQNIYAQKGDRSLGAPKLISFHCNQHFFMICPEAALLSWERKQKVGIPHFYSALVLSRDLRRSGH
jgi:hypothetical protein